jgi:hypothetical protein
MLTDEVVCMAGSFDELDIGVVVTVNDISLFHADEGVIAKGVH